MLAEELKKELSDKTVVIKHLTGWKNKKTRRLTFFNDATYGCGANIYLMSKKDYKSSAEALCAAWMNQYLWEEDIEADFDFSEMSAATIYDETFAYESEKYIYKAIDEHTLKKLINQGVKSVAEIMQRQKADERVGFLEKAGVYVDKAYTTKNSYIFKTDEKVKDAVILSQEQGTNKLQLYKTMFFETDLKYGFYCD